MSVKANEPGAYKTVKNLRTVRAAFISALLLLPPVVLADSAYEVYAQMSQQDCLNTDNEATLDALSAAALPSYPGQGLSGTVRRPGEVVFAYGNSLPQILCQVLELTDVAFEPGELIETVQIGDGARWSVQSAQSGSAVGKMQQHLVIKPFDSGLRTSLLVTTDKRTYHLTLKSSLKGFMPMVRFTYPEDEIKRLNAKARELAAYQERNTIAGTGVTVDQLCFAYELDGDEDLKPVRVFNDGRKTFIELSAAFKGAPLPALLCVEQEGGLFSGDKLSVVNYRVQGTRYVLDGVPSHLRLLSGGDGGLSCDIRLHTSKS